MDSGKHPPTTILPVQYLVLMIDPRWRRVNSSVANFETFSLNLSSPLRLFLVVPKTTSGTPGYFSWCFFFLEIFLVFWGPTRLFRSSSCQWTAGADPSLSRYKVVSGGHSPQSRCGDDKRRRESHPCRQQISCAHWSCTLCTAGCECKGLFIPTLKLVPAFGHKMTWNKRTWSQTV